jgi:hypothetical protein
MPHYIQADAEAVPQPLPSVYFSDLLFLNQLII